MTYPLRLVAFLLALPLVLTAIRAAESPEPPAKATGSAVPSAKDVIGRFVKEIGGAKAFEAIQSQRMTGRFEMGGQGLNGTVEVLAKRPDKLVMKISLPGLGDMVQGYDGTVGWTLNAATGPMLLEGKMLEQVREQAQFDAALHAETQFKSMVNTGKTQFEGKEVYRLNLVRNSGQEVTEFYEVASGLLVGSTEMQETPLGSMGVTAVIGEYKKFGEILFATRLVQKMGPLAQVLAFEQMEFNTVNDAAFELPATIKALIKR